MIITILKYLDLIQSKTYKIFKNQVQLNNKF